MLRYQDIFVPGGFPHYTYSSRIELKLEEKLSAVKENLCKLVAVTGQTKCGKTVLARKVFPRDTSIWIDGGTVSEENHFWQVIVDQLDLFQLVGREVTEDSTSKFGGKGTAEANFFVAKGSGELSAGIEKSHGSSKKSSRSLSSRVVALRGLRINIPLVIDDFHYIPREIQGTLIRALKPLIFDGLPVVIIAIPHRRYDALKVEKEMTGRISPIDIPTWSDTELQFISKTGFELLNYRVLSGSSDQHSSESVGSPLWSATDMKSIAGAGIGLLNYRVPAEFEKQLSSESIGSPHLMQDFCRGLCKLLNISHKKSPEVLVVSRNQVEKVFRDVAETIGRPIFEKLAHGPRQRTDRIQRRLKDGRTVDIYGLVLSALAYIRPGLVSLEYEALRAAIKAVSAEHIPQLHEVERVLKYMTTIASTDQSSSPVIDFDGADKRLHITDPFFAFYLRWGDISEDVFE